MLFQYLVSFSAFICGNCIFPLTVDETLYNQSLKDKEAIQYIVKDLQVGARYEVRVSYPSVIPTDFVIDVGVVEDAFLSRSLLNVEQMHFVAQQSVYFVKVTAYRTGVPLRLERLSDPAQFNIIVNRLYLGCSIATWKIIVFGLILNGLAVMYLVPFIIKVLQVYAEKTEHIY
ncbi:uncharacterized protein LOC100202199 isoform X1 [Hydra vulgaris]|uniref:Uncharacterized protein LOC100202199 isoform X1 n=1 Tax=Hydra vulgaris TaxID=6087 RepID=A0ABM4CX54_HYDVU